MNLFNEKIISQIIESGSNSNGNYVKYADGTMICYGRIYDDITINNVYTPGVYYMTKRLTFPKTFIDIPTITITPLNLNNLLSSNIYSISSSAVDLFVYSFKSLTGIATRINYIAIGKWK